MKKIIILLFVFFIKIRNIFAVSADDIKPTKGTDLRNPSGGNSDLGVSDFFVWLKAQTFDIVFIVAIGVIVFIGIRLTTARGNPEAMTKTWTHLIYFAIGIFVIFASISIIQLIANLGENLT